MAGQLRVRRYRDGVAVLSVPLLPRGAMAPGAALVEIVKRRVTTGAEATDTLLGFGEAGLVSITPVLKNPLPWLAPV